MLCVFVVQCVVQGAHVAFHLELLFSHDVDVFVGEKSPTVVEGTPAMTVGDMTQSVRLLTTSNSKVIGAYRIGRNLS